MDGLLNESRMGSVMVLIMNNPAKRNALSGPMRAAMAAALSRAEADSSVRALVIAGQGEHFCSGGDVDAMSQASDLAAGRERVRVAHAFLQLLSRLSKPLVAAVEGWAAGAGMSVALCADTVIASAEARFLASFARLGLVADLGLMHTLAQRVGAARARQILLHAREIHAAEAKDIGLVDEVVPPGEALERAVHCAGQLALNAPLSMACTKAFFTRGLESVLEWEKDVQAQLFLSQDHLEGRAAFKEKRPAVFQGR